MAEEARMRRLVALRAAPLLCWCKGCRGQRPQPHNVREQHWYGTYLNRNHPDDPENRLAWEAFIRADEERARSHGVPLRNELAQQPAFPYQMVFCDVCLRFHRREGFRVCHGLADAYLAAVLAQREALPAEPPPQIPTTNHRALRGTALPADAVMSVDAHPRPLSADPADTEENNMRALRVLSAASSDDTGLAAHEESSDDEREEPEESSASAENCEQSATDQPSAPPPAPSPLPHLTRADYPRLIEFAKYRYGASEQLHQGYLDVFLFILELENVSTSDVAKALRSGRRNSSTLSTSPTLLTLPSCPKCFRIHNPGDVDDEDLPHGSFRGILDGMPSAPRSRDAVCSFPFHGKSRTEQGQQFYSTDNAPAPPFLYALTRGSRLQPALGITVASIVAQLPRVLSRNLDDITRERPASPERLEDISDGVAYQELKRVMRLAGPPAPDRKAVYLALILSVDWCAPFERSYSVGVLHLTIADISRAKRGLPDNALYAVAMHGPKEATTTLNEQLPFLVAELKLLHAGVDMKLNGEMYTVYARILFCCSDLPAQAKLFATAGHTADRFCPFCQVSAGQGAVEHQPWLSADKRARTSDGGSSLTAGARKRRRAPGVSTVAGSAQNEDEDEDGHTASKGYCVKGAARSEDVERERARTYKTIREGDHRWHPENLIDGSTRYTRLREVPGFDAVGARALDAMHNLLLGNVKSAIQALSNSAKGNDEDAPFADVDAMQEIVDKTVAPSRAKILGKIGSGYDHMTAHDWRLFVQLYIMPIVDRLGLAPRRKSHFLQLAVIVFVATQRSLLRHDVDVLEELVTKFVETTGATLPAAAKPNTHFMLHMTECMRRFGPASATWLFAAERLNKIIKNVPHSNRPGDMERLMMSKLLQPPSLSEEEQRVLDNYRGRSHRAVPSQYGRLVGVRPDERDAMIRRHRLPENVDQVSYVATLPDGTRLSDETRPSSWRVLVYVDGRLLPAFAQVFYSMGEQVFMRATVFTPPEQPDRVNDCLSLSASFSPALTQYLDLFVLKWNAARYARYDVPLKLVAGLCALVPTTGTEFFALAIQTL